MGCVFAMSWTKFLQHTESFKSAQIAELFMKFMAELSIHGAGILAIAESITALHKSVSTGHSFSKTISLNPPSKDTRVKVCHISPLAFTILTLSRSCVRLLRISPQFCVMTQIPSIIPPWPPEQRATHLGTCWISPIEHYTKPPSEWPTISKERCALTGSRP
jgi:hypothetical protein